MTTVAFDTLKFARRLEVAGIPATQAAGLAEAFSEVMVTELATKADLRALELATRADLHALELASKAELRELRVDLTSEFRISLERLRGDLRAEIASSKSDMLRWIVPLMLAHMGLSLGVLLRVTG